jgi:ATP-binding cassette subfamily C (CFTR/MRP) protein 1
MLSPLLIRYLINFVRRSSQARAAGIEPPPIGQGVGAAIGLSLMLFAASLCNHSFFMRSTSSGVLLRGALISFIFNRGLRLTGEERAKGLGNGKLTNHISTESVRPLPIPFAGCTI